MERRENISSNLVTAAGPRLLERLREVLRGMHYSYRTEKTYPYWVRYFIFWSGKRHPTRLWARQR